MTRRQAFKFELIPNGEQARNMLRFAGSCRFVYNKALALEQERYKQGEKRLGYFGMSKLLPTWKKELEWLSNTPAQVLQQVLKNLDRAYVSFFNKRTTFPKFKKKGCKVSFLYPQRVKLDQLNGRVSFPKLGWIRYRSSREVLGTVKNAIVSLSNGKWYVSVQTEREVSEPVHPSVAIAGLDMGVTRFVTLSDGSRIDPLNSFRKQEARLRKYQRRMSSKKKFSNNWKKAKAKVQKIYAKIANCRKDFLHKASETISKNHAVVVIEDLNIAGMSRSRLSKSILDQGWGEFRRQLEYKQGWLGGQVIAVPAHNTSRTCPSCEHVSALNRQTQAQFLCVECGFAENADLVGALNVLARGHRVLACGGDLEVRGPLKQEPTEETQATALNSVGISVLLGRGGCQPAELAKKLALLAESEAYLARLRAVLWAKL
jgi:putative transposase